MQQSLQDKLTRTEERHEELRQLLADPDVLARPDRYRELSQEFARLEPLMRTLEEYRRALAELENNEAMAADSDPEIRTLAETELAHTRERIESLEDELQRLMLPSDPYDDSSVYVEIRAGTGGDEAALFAGDLLRMYTRYAEREGWAVDIVSASEGEQGGYREVVLHVSGTGAYGRLKFESGAHRVQRVPKTESQGRIHTSACTVAVLPETESVEDVTIHDQDLRVDTFRASGAGGQHVNTTDSAVRITHLPSGVVVESQQERSQHKNRARALSVLKAKLVAMEQARQAREREDTRRSLIGSGDRSERIRTYNFPQSRVTDHRIDLTLYKLDDILDGALEPVIDPLLREHQLAQLGEMAS